ncbi:MAG: CheW-like domain protein [Gemmataceae bacterium]|nr:CheW-like domain protein [Gemmataceae bacterium]
MNATPVSRPTPLPVLDTSDPCWHRIGVWGDRSCPELRKVTHCHNCPVFAAAGRRFLDAPPPPGYPAEWTERLAIPEDGVAGGLLGVLVFRLAEEWFAVPVGVLVEVTHPRAPHRVPHRGGLLAGLVNIRGELHLCVRLDLLLGIDLPAQPREGNPRLIVVRRDLDGWVFLADDVDQVHRVPERELVPAPPTLSRAASRLTRGVFSQDGRAVGLLDEDRLFQALRERVR